MNLELKEIFGYCLFRVHGRLLTFEQLANLGFFNAERLELITTCLRRVDVFTLYNGHLYAEIFVPLNHIKILTDYVENIMFE